MVSYQTMVRIAFDIAESKGGEFSGIDDGGQFLSELGTLWNENKDEVRQMTEQQTRNFLNERIQA